MHKRTRRCPLVQLAVVILTISVGIGACEQASTRENVPPPADRFAKGEYAKQVMPAYLSGVALGMDWETLKRTRPAIGYDGDLIEMLSVSTVSTIVHYYFSDPARSDTAYERPLTGGAALSMIEILAPGVPRSDTAAYRALVHTAVARLDSVLGPADSVIHCVYTTSVDSAPRTWYVWRERDVTVLLESHALNHLSPAPIRWADLPDSPLDQRRDIAIIIQSPRLPIGIGFWSRRIRPDECRSLPPDV